MLSASSQRAGKSKFVISRFHNFLRRFNMDADDARLVRIYTAEANTFLENTTPNAAIPTPAANFDVVIEGQAGSAKGTSGQNYALRFDAVDLTAGNKHIPFSGSFAQNFSTTFWTAIAPGGDFRNVTSNNLVVTASEKGHIFQYTASLVTPNFDVVSFVVSEPFLIV
jgi:hypothetical protein